MIVRYVDVNGERIFFDEEEMKYEYRCNWCGEFLDINEAYVVQGAITNEKDPVKAFSLHAHFDCYMNMIGRYLK